jgi:serine protease Do
MGVTTVLSRRSLVIAGALVATVAFLLGVVATQALLVPPADAPRVVPPAALAAQPVERPPAVVTVAAGVDFSAVAAMVNEAVVNIDTATSGDPDGRRGRRPLPDELLDDPNGTPPPRAPRPGSGSGFLIEPNGYLLTNFHVVEDAERIRVTLADGRVFRGEVVGTDPAIDVALVKIPADSALPVVRLGDSDALRVGEWVCAIGNPLGYVHSVTVGVVSFIGRKLFDPSLDHYIQTDAAINFGNSGGPLINARGEVVGINSAISSRANNIGFAVPINQVRAVLPQLKTRGRVSRGYIGVSLVDVTPDLRRALGLEDDHGALVTDVAPGSPGERAGLKVYDRIREVDDRAVTSNEDLIREISRRAPGTVVRLRVEREGRDALVTVKLAERPVPEARGAGAGLSRPAGGTPHPPGPPTIGLSVRDLDEAFIQRFGVPDDVRGVVAAVVDPAGAAAAAGIRRGFIVVEVNRRPVRTARDFARVLAESRPGDAVALYVYNPVSGQRDLIAVTVDATQ